MPISLLVRSVCFVVQSEASCWVDGVLPVSLSMNAQVPVALSAASPHPGAWLSSLKYFWMEQYRSTQACTPRCTSPSFFSPGTAQPVLQTLSRGLLPPSLISIQPSATVNKQNVKFLVGSLLANRVQPSRHAGLLQTPKIIFSLEENMTQYSVYTLYICQNTAPFWDWSFPRHCSCRAWKLIISEQRELWLWQNLEPSYLGFQSFAVSTPL